MEPEDKYLLILFNKVFYGVQVSEQQVWKLIKQFCVKTFGASLKNPSGV